jgi:hypothetical protein
MARFSRTQLLSNLSVTSAANVATIINNSLPSASALEAEDFRVALNAMSVSILDSVAENFRHLPNVSSAFGTMFEIGSSPDNWFDMDLLEEGGGGLILPGGDPSGTGFQLVPIVTGNDTSVAWPAASGSALNSEAFDGVEEVFLGTGATANMFKIDYDGKWDVVASCKPAPDGTQNNREVETDLWVFDGTGTPVRSIGFIASANQGSGGRTFTQNIPRTTLNEVFLGDDEWVGLVVRKYAGEGNTTVTLQKAFIQITLTGLGD